MRYWWVNQNQTYEQEVRGGYLWSPKRRSDGTRHPYYEFMRGVAPGDLVFSFAKARISAYGIARSHAYEAPKPLEFGSAGRNWDAIGWRVDVEFREVEGFRPKDHLPLLRPLLPERHSPLQPETGSGRQSIYLTSIPEPLALELARLLHPEALALARAELTAEAPLLAPNRELFQWEEHLQRSIRADPSLDETERESLVLARRGQGRFRELVAQRESRCRVTGVDRPEHLRASHCKPWRDADNRERLDPANGLMLTPSIDHLFDRGFISFEQSGRLLISPVAHLPSLARMGIERERDVGPFRPEQARYLEYHRDAVWLKPRVAL